MTHRSGVRAGRRLLGLLVGILVLGLSACGGSTTSGGPAPTPASPTATATATATPVRTLHGTIREFRVPSTSPGNQTSVPVGLVIGPDGNLWFTEWLGNQIGRITPSGVFTEFAMPTGSPGSETTSAPSGLVVGPDGNLWFTERMSNQIGQVT